MHQPNIDKKIVLYDYQEKIVNESRQCIAEKIKNILIVSPTGSGKTIIFSFIAESVMKKNKRVLIITHREEILEQTIEKLFSYGIQSGQIRSGKLRTRDNIQVAMVLTLNNCLDEVGKFDLIIIDEAHHFRKTTVYGKALLHFEDVPKLFFTATPELLSGEGLGINAHGFCEKMILGPSTNYLVSNGFLSYPIIYRPPNEIDFKFHIKQGDFDKTEMEKAYSQPHIVGDVIKHYRERLNNLPAICFCCTIKHSKIMADVFNENGIPAIAVYSGMNKIERKAAFKKLKTCEIKILTNCSLIDEGVDVPSIAGVILLKKTQSLAKYLQMCGRALRLYPGKEHAVILDHAGNYHIHGHCLLDREWSLNAIKRSKRKKVELKTTSCPKCGSVWPGSPLRCPGIYPNGDKCGFVFSVNPDVAGQQRKTPKQIEGELIAALPNNIDKTDLNELTNFVNRLHGMDGKKRQKALLAKSYELSKCNNYDEFKKLMKPLSEAVGYKAGWSNYVWKNILKK
jgi:DNA repair protein RadD